jgi:hypothetical protein
MCALKHLDDIELRVCFFLGQRDLEGVLFLGQSDLEGALFFFTQRERVKEDAEVLGF